MVRTISSKCHASVTSSFSETKAFFCFLFNTRSPEDALRKLGFFACVISRKGSADQQKQYYYGTMLFMSKQVSLPKISLILEKMKIGPKSDIHPFCTKAFNCELTLEAHMASTLHFSPLILVVFSHLSGVFFLH